MKYSDKGADSVQVSPSGGTGLSGKAFFSVPANIELWFAVNIKTPDTLTTGAITFGDMLCLSDGSSYYPMENHGFKTVGRADIPKASNPPMDSVVVFFGQCQSGRLGITNTTDGTINLSMVCRPRRIEE